MPKTKRVEMKCWVLWSSQRIEQDDGRKRAGAQPWAGIWESKRRLVNAVCGGPYHHPDVWPNMKKANGYRALPATVVVEVPDE